jgi:hypothetical protein
MGGWVGGGNVPADGEGEIEMGELFSHFLYHGFTHALVEV